MLFLFHAEFELCDLWHALRGVLFLALRGQLGHQSCWVYIFEIMIEYMEHKYIAVRNANRDKWVDPLVHQPAWFGANKLTQETADIGIEPDTPRMDPLLRLSACVPGPKDGAVFGGRSTEEPVRHTFLNRYCSEVSEASIATMTTCLNSDNCQWLHMSTDDDMPNHNGAVDKDLRVGFRGITSVNMHLAGPRLFFSNTHKKKNMHIMCAMLTFMLRILVLSRFCSRAQTHILVRICCQHRYWDDGGRAH